jgi:diguanylate cyclase (GGDEF)-like protein
VAGSRFFEALLVADENGELLHRAGPSPLPADADWAGGGNAPLWAAGSPATSEHLVTSVPFGARGQVLHGVYRRSALRAVLDVGGLGPSGNVCLLDARGRLIGPLCSRPPRAGLATQPLPLAELSAGRAAIFSGAGDGRLIGAVRPASVLDWSLLVEEPFTEAFEPVFQAVVRVVVIDACILLAFSFLAFKLTRAIVRPIDALSEGARRIAQGELDFPLPRTTRRDEIGLLTETFAEMTRKLLANQREIQQANQKLKTQNDELQRANEVLEQLSITDGLTKLHNHRFFQDHLTREIKRVSRTHEPLSMLVIDIDDFKQLNDRQGHKAGDELLIGLARILNESSRENDFLARYGGEEFVVLAPVTDVPGAVALAEKIRGSVEEASFILGDSKRLTKVTISVGVAAYKGNRRAFFQAADQALYRAKAEGKNCVVSDEE